MNTKEEFVNSNQFIYTNIIIGFFSFISSIIIITLYLRKKELKENNYTIFTCIAVSNLINSITQFFGLILINYQQSTINRKWYANTQRILNLMAEFSYVYYSLYYFYYIYETINTFKKTHKYLYHIIICIFLFALFCSIFFVVAFNLYNNDDSKIKNFNDLYFLNRLFSVDEVEKNGFFLIFYHILFIFPLIAYLIIINQLRSKLSQSLKEDEAKKIMFLKKIYDFIIFLLLYGILYLAIKFLYDIFEKIFYDNILRREIYYLRVEYFFSFLINLLANSRGVIYFFIFLIDDKVTKLLSEYIYKISIIHNFKKFLID